MSLQSDADRTFLALCLWREARGEQKEGRLAIASSILNRISSPTWSSNTVMGIIFQRLQYSSLTYASDPQLAVWPSDTDAVWKDCLTMADGVLARTITGPVGKADSYHDTSIKPPAWATPEKFVTQIGRLKFYRIGK